MFSFEMAAVKANFFDTSKVQDAIDKAARQQLSKFGAFVRHRAKTSIRTSKKISKPGKPPASHTGLLKKFIFFSYDPASKSVVIGPVKLKQATGAQRTLEHGGNVVILSLGGRRQMARYRPRPYMRPAFEAELTKMPELWTNCIR